MVIALLTSCEKYDKIIDRDDLIYYVEYTGDRKILDFVDIFDDAFDANITAHKWHNGIGRIYCDKPIKKIGYGAFYNCDSLESINIPDSVTSIGDNAFCFCDELKSVYCRATTPPQLGNNVFYYNASGRKIYVPRNSVYAYKSAAGWSNYAADIVGYDFE